MTINEIARITVMTEQALAELTDMSAMDRMEFITAFQARLILAALNGSAADSQPGADSRRPVPLLPVETGRDHHTGTEIADGLRGVLECSPHGESL